MGISDISLTASMRTNLFSLQTTTSLLSRTQERLASGKKVNSALDNPTNFFAAQSHSQRASDLSIRKDGMTEAVQGTQAANKGITAITSLIEAAKGLLQTARSADFTNREALAKQFNNIREQIDTIAGDSSYKGKNFLKADTLNVLFNESGGALLKLSGFDATSNGLSISAVALGVASVSRTATGTTAIVGSGIIDIAVHTATLSDALMTGVIVQSNHFIGSLSGAVIGNSGADSGINTWAGIYLSGSTLSGMSTGMGANGVGIAAGSGYIATDNTKSVYVTNIYVDGVDQTALLGAFSWLSGLTATSGYLLEFSGVTSGTAIAAGIKTGSVITMGLSIAMHAVVTAATSTFTIVTGFNVYNLAGGDLASGMFTSGAAGSVRVFISGTEIAASGASGVYTIDFANNRIYFSGAFTPPKGGVTYEYNTGFLTTGQQMATTDQMIFTGQGLAGNQEITSVMVNGVTGVLGSDYTITGGNSIVFAVGIGTGSTISYTVKTTTAQVNGGWTSDVGIDASVEELTAALSYMRTQSANLASNLSVINVRQEFADGMVTTLLKGADNLTLADMNEEGANMLMLQTRQQLGTTSLKMASDTAAAVMRLF